MKQMYSMQRKRSLGTCYGGILFAVGASLVQSSCRNGGVKFWVSAAAARHAVEPLGFNLQLLPPDPAAVARAEN